MVLNCETSSVSFCLDFGCVDTFITSTMLLFSYSKHWKPFIQNNTLIEASDVTASLLCVGSIPSIRICVSSMCLIPNDFIDICRELSANSNLWQFWEPLIRSWVTSTVRCQPWIMSFFLLIETNVRKETVCILVRSKEISRGWASTCVSGITWTTVQVFYVSFIIFRTFIHVLKEIFFSYWLKSCYP